MNTYSENTDYLSKGMAHLVTTVQELSLARDLESIMKIVRTVARKLTGADGATFVLRDNGFCYYADEDAIHPLWKGNRFPMEICISGWAMINKEAAIIEDIYKDNRIPHEAYRPTFVKSLAMVPIRTLDPIGAIGNYWAHQHMPTAEQIILLRSLADITAVAMENVRVYQELEERVKERTLQLESANKQLEAFSYSVSHDLKNPLSGVNGLLQIMSEDYMDQLDEVGQEMIRLMLKETKHMDSLIMDLLMFFTADKTEITKNPVDMNVLVDEICKKVKAQYNDNKIVIRADDLPEVNASPALIQQVWTNLISNAAKFSSKKEQGVIHIGSHKSDTEVTYFVKDNGTGFDMKNYDKLFGAFQRLHGSKEFEGTGIGLSIVEKIISRHNGKIWAESVPGEGASFYFSLPV